jgi:predicted Zn-dependent protease
VDAAFLETLTDAELEAAVAHELGHVWVFTHHPYLQTEALANQIAMRVVSRQNLQRVYEKMWDQNGVKGNLLDFLGPDDSGSIVAR